MKPSELIEKGVRGWKTHCFSRAECQGLVLGHASNARDRPQRHLCQMLEPGRFLSKIRLVKGGKSITIKNKLLQPATQLDTLAVAVKARKIGASRVATRLERVASRTARGVL